MILAPEIVLFNTIKSVLSFIRTDYDNNSDKTKTMLYKLLNGNSIGNYDFYKQGKEIFLKLTDDPRKLEVRLPFDPSRAPIPTIHINLPNEQSGQNGIGVDEGFEDAETDEDEGIFNRNYTRRFDTNYNIIITSDNSNEVIVIYHFLRAFLISIFNHLSLSGLENAKMGGYDLQLNSSLVPNHIYSRAINISFSYEITVPDLFSELLISNFSFVGTPVDNGFIDDSESFI